MAVIGLDLGATKLVGALFGADGAILERSSALLEGRGGADVGRLIVEQPRSLLAAAEARGEMVEAVAVSVPGIAHHEDGTVWAPNIPGWERYPLREALAAEVGEKCPVAVESDRACSILGETARGCARGRRHAVFLAVGTGIGAGILVDGAILRGARDIAGAIGWMGLDRPYREVYDERGGFESSASGFGIARAAREFLGATPDYQDRLRTIESDQLSAHDVFTAYKLGDALAVRVVANAVECWGMAVANVTSLFDPEIVVLGGGLFGPAAAESGRIIAEAKRWAQPISGDPVLGLTGLMLFLQGGIEITLGGWSPQYAREALGLSQERSILILSLFWVGMMLARMILSRLLRSRSPSVVYPVYLASALAGAGLLLTTRSPAAAGLGLALLGGGLSAGYPVLLGFLGERYHDLTGTAFSAVFVVALIGGSVPPFATGVVGDRYGLGASLSVVPICVVAQGLLFAPLCRLVDARGERERYGISGIEESSDARA